MVKDTNNGQQLQKYSTDEEEDELMDFLSGSAKIVYPQLTREGVFSLVQTLLIEKGGNISVTSGWWESFKKKHPEVTLCVAEHLSHWIYLCCEFASLIMFEFLVSW